MLNNDEITLILKRNVQLPQEMVCWLTDDLEEESRLRLRCKSMREAEDSPWVS
jgi:hypothetical protein